MTFRERVQYTLQEERNKNNEILAKIGVTASMIYPAYRLFLWKAPFACVVATIPVISYLNSKFNFTPFISKLVGLGVFSLLVAVSWFAAEVIVLLAAAGMAGDIVIIYKVIKSKNQQVKERQLNPREDRSFNVREASRRMRATI